MSGAPPKRGFAARPSTPDAWVRAPEAQAKQPDPYTARLTIDVTPVLRGRIKITAFERGRPMLSGITVPGNTTRLRIGRSGMVLGTVVCCPAMPDLMTVCVSVREMIWGSDMGSFQLAAGSQQ